MAKIFNLIFALNNYGFFKILNFSIVDVLDIILVATIILCI